MIAAILMIAFGVAILRHAVKRLNHIHEEAWRGKCPTHNSFSPASSQQPFWSR